jgi:LacI family transcriptional regulator
MNTMQNKRVAIVCNAGHVCGQDLIEGISDFLRTSRVPWLVFLPYEFKFDLNRVASMNFDGVIADFDYPENRAVVAKLDVPVVGVGSRFVRDDDYPGGISYVATDDEALVNAAYQHLIDMGLTRFAMLSVSDVVALRWAGMREHYFRQLMTRDQLPIEIYRGDVAAEQSWDEATAQLTAWVQSLPKPIGIIAVGDPRARQLLQACVIAGIPVPEDVAVIGINNDPASRNLTRISLSSVRQGSVELGRIAAQLLSQQLSGVPTVERRFVPPLGVNVGASSRHEAIQNAYVRRGRHFIRQFACQGIKSEQVADYVGISRASLDLHFQAELGRSVHDEILRFKLDAAKSVLASERCNIAELAVNCGFTSVNYMYKVFRRELGCTPREYQDRMLGLL